MVAPTRVQEVANGLANRIVMETTDVAKRVANETADVLATIPLVAGNEYLSDHLFDQLVDLLLESMLVELRTRLTDGVINAGEYASELAILAGQCRSVGLLDRS
ncbi:MAG: hypothetical protein JWO68_3528 [Actinomycetia bacterium]|nr:hypothetical protein [Actinomycetes bacterium]